MPEYDNDMTGVLFRNNKKVEGSKQPDFNGKCEIEGKEYQLSAWVKEGQNCGKFFSISIQPKWVPEGEAVGAASAPAVDDLPF